MTDLGIIISTYNRPKSLSHLLDILDDQRCIDLRGVDVCVVNDGGVSPTFKNYRFHFEYIHRDRLPNGVSRVYSSRNIAASHVDGDYILQLDDDLEFHIYFLSFLQSMAYMTTDNLWVWCPRISNNTDVDVSGYSTFDRGKDGRWFDGKCQWQQTHWQSSSSAGMFMPRELWNRVGGYDEQFDGSMGASDQELTLRCQKAGAKVWIYPAFVNIADEETGSWRMPMIERALKTGRERNETIFDKLHPDAKDYTNV